MEDIQTDVEFRIMPSGDGGWYWEVIADARSAISRGLAIARVQHSQEASEAAKAKQRSVRTMIDAVAIHSPDQSAGSKPWSAECGANRCLPESSASGWPRTYPVRAAHRERTPANTRPTGADDAVASH